jgi:hypothetical protein
MDNKPTPLSNTPLQPLPLQPDDIVIDINPPPKSRKMFRIILIALLMLLLIGAGIFAFFKLTEFSVMGLESDDYTYDDFIALQLSTQTDDTLWSLNGWDFYQGKEPRTIPIAYGENTLQLTRGNREIVRNLNITQGQIILMTDYALSPEDADYDGDRLTNKEEDELGTKIYLKDTDGDGVDDGVELMLGTDPLNPRDGQVSHTWRTYLDGDTDSGIYLDVTGRGNITTFFVDSDQIDPLQGTGIVLSPISRIISTDNIKYDELILSYDNTNNKYGDSNVAIFSYKPTRNKLNKLDTEIDGDVIKAKINDLSELYFIGRTNETVSTTNYSLLDILLPATPVYADPTSDAIAENVTFGNQIGILIDNSGSMFSPEQLTEIGYTAKGPHEDFGRDPDGIRFDRAKQIVDAYEPDSTQFLINHFADTVCTSPDTWHNSSDAHSRINNINTSNTGCGELKGTDYINATIDTESAFQHDSLGLKDLFILTDGFNADDSAVSTKASSDSLEIVLEQIMSRSTPIRIFTVCAGEGESCDEEGLRKLAEGTGGKFCKILEECIGEQKVDRYDSGFVVTRDGFNFNNFSSSSSDLGNCFGITRIAIEAYNNGSYTFVDDTYTFGQQNSVYSLALGDPFYGGGHYRNADSATAGLLQGSGWEDKDCNNSICDLRFLDTANINNISQKHQVHWKIFRAISDRQQNQDPTATDGSNHNGRIRLPESEVSKVIDTMARGEVIRFAMGSEAGRHAVVLTSITRDHNGIYTFELYDSNHPGEYSRIVLKKVAENTNPVINSYEIDVGYDGFSEITVEYY